jgi:membrane-associated phospholipid phosphatase
VIVLTKEAYERMTRMVRTNPGRVVALNLANKSIARAVYLAYPMLIVYLAFNNDERLWKAIVGPGISFVLVSLFRSRMNKPRPYEVLGITPLISKDTKGKSFPSRHVFSIFVIATVFCHISLPIGVVLMVAGALLAAIRVVGGVHFPGDVIAGAAIGILSGIAGFILVP